MPPLDVVQNCLVLSHEGICTHALSGLAEDAGLDLVVQGMLGDEAARDSLRSRLQPRVEEVGRRLEERVRTLERHAKDSGELDSGLASDLLTASKLIQKAGPFDLVNAIGILQSDQRELERRRIRREFGEEVAADADAVSAFSAVDDLGFLLKFLLEGDERALEEFDR